MANTARQRRLRTVSEKLRRSGLAMTRAENDAVHKSVKETIARAAKRGVKVRRTP